MANVTVTCRNFTGVCAATNGVRLRNVSRRAVLRAVITVGAQRFLDIFSLGWRGLLHRFGMGLSAFSFLEQSPAGLCLSDRFSSLDSSEKGVMSYWYGMALAKIIADIELGVPWLAHVDQMRKSGALTTLPGSNERGDLVGRGANADWHGRSQGTQQLVSCLACNEGEEPIRESHIHQWSATGHDISLHNLPIHPSDIRSP